MGCHSYVERMEAAERLEDMTPVRIKRAFDFCVDCIRTNVAEVPELPLVAAELIERLTALRVVSACKSTSVPYWAHLLYLADSGKELADSAERVEPVMLRLGFIEGALWMGGLASLETIKSWTRPPRHPIMTFSAEDPPQSKLEGLVVARDERSRPKPVVGLVERAVGRAVASAAIVSEPDGRVWLLSGGAGVGGYQDKFPGQSLEYGYTLDENAAIAAYDCLGMTVQIKRYLGDFEVTDSGLTRFYLAKRIAFVPFTDASAWRYKDIKLADTSDAMNQLGLRGDRKALQMLLDLKEYEDK